MSSFDYTGYWTGKIEGTNQGGFSLDIKQEGNKLSGTAKIFEPSLGQYEYTVSGSAEQNFSAFLTPGNAPSRIALGRVQVLGSIDANGTLSGRWKSDIGTEGIFTAKKFEAEELVKELPTKNSVFLVHGHNEGSKHAVARFLEQIGVTPVILHEQINRGMTIIEKFEEFASRAGFAVILMTPDDYGYPVGKDSEIKSRPRQNVVLELGYFVARLGRDKTFVLVKGDIEMPSDVFGIVYEPLDDNHGWKMKLAAELTAAGFTIDLNKAIATPSSS